MLVLMREELGEMRLAYAQEFLSLIQDISKGGGYDRDQRLEITEQHPVGGQILLATWTPETGWATTVFADVNGGDGKLLQSHLLLHEVTERLYAGADSLEPVAFELCHLFAAIAEGTRVEWPEDESDKYADVVKLCRGLFPEGHAIWKHITITRGEDRADTAGREAIREHPEGSRVRDRRFRDRAAGTGRRTAGDRGGIAGQPGRVPRPRPRAAVRAHRLRRR